jgi:hypothetical protein
MIVELESKLTRALPWILLTIVSIIFFAQPAFSQFDAGKIEAELDKTDRLIETTHQIISESGNAQSASYLERAVIYQEKAWDQFHAELYQSAQNFTDLARESLDKAVGAIKRSDENRSAVEHEIERTDEILSQTKEKVDQGGQRYSLTMMDNAVATQNKAHELFNENRQRMALTATLKARELAQKGLESTQEYGRVLRELEKTDQLLERTREMLGGLNLAQTPPVLANAIRLHEKAWELYQNKKYSQAYDNTVSARKQTLDAIDRFEKQVQKEHLPKVMEDLKTKAENIGDQLNQNYNKMAMRLLERAHDELNKADLSHNGGNTKKAMYHLRRANNFLDQASEIVSP